MQINTLTGNNNTIL